MRATLSTASAATATADDTVPPLAGVRLVLGAAMPAPLASRADRGVGAFGLCRNEDGLIPSIEGVAFGLLPRKDRGSSPKNPPTMSSSAPKVGVCSIGEMHELACECGWAQALTKQKWAKLKQVVPKALSQLRRAGEVEFEGKKLTADKHAAVEVTWIGL